MENKAFNWYEDAMEVESAEFQPSDKRRNISQRIFDLAVTLFNYIALIASAMFVIRFVFNARRVEISEMSFDAILLCVAVYFGSLSIITNAMRFIAFITQKLAAEGFELKVRSAYRWVALSIWYLLNLYLIKFIKPEIRSVYYHTKAYLQCGLLSSISYTCVTVAMAYFYEYFLEKSMYIKMRDVEQTERIIVAMKNFRYEATDTSSESTRECNCVDLFCGSHRHEQENDEHIELRGRDERKVGTLYFKPPELGSLYDAKTLARDVYETATGDEKDLSFENFASIFPNTQIALQAFSYFDSDENKTIERKEFRDTIIQFFVDRVNLEKNFLIAKGFVDIIGDTLSLVVFSFLILAYLVIFGIPLRELIALALSSALLLNFVVSGMASDLYYNFMVLLTHPFDIGDDIIIDDVDYKVYKIGLTSTSVLGINGGKVKFLNSVLWKKTLINMTRAPEKIIVFSFKLPPDIDLIKFAIFKSKIMKYLRERPYDFYETFSLEAKSEQSVDINSLDCVLILRSRSYKTKSKKFNLRVEVTKMLHEIRGNLQLDCIYNK